VKLLVFGATGGTGHQIVELALAQGHDVTAFARNPAKLGVEHANLEVVRGDVTDFASVAKAARGRDAYLRGAPGVSY